MRRGERLADQNRAGIKQPAGGNEKKKKKERPDQTEPRKQRAAAKLRWINGGIVPDKPGARQSNRPERKRAACPKEGVKVKLEQAVHLHAVSSQLDRKEDGNKDQFR